MPRRYKKAGKNKGQDRVTQSPYLAKHPPKKWGKRELQDRAAEMLRIDPDLFAEALDSQAMSPCQTLAGSMLAVESAARREECEAAVKAALARVTY